MLSTIGEDGDQGIPDKEIGKKKCGQQASASAGWIRQHIWAETSNVVCAAAKANKKVQQS